MAVEYGRLRSVLLEYLKAKPRGQVTVVSGGGDFRSFLEQRGLNLDDEGQVQILQTFHEFYLERIIIPGAEPNSTAPMKWPFYRLTDYGRKVIDSQEYQPYDPDGYLARITNDIKDVDPVIIRYLAEALGCLRADHLLASAVMLGCAAEKAMLLLVDAFGAAMSDPKTKAAYEKQVASRMISSKYDALWKRLEPLAGSLPADLGDDLHVLLDRVFDLIRTARNDAGHPTGKPMDRDAVRVNLTFFPGYCKRVYGLMAHFKANPVV